MEYRHKIRDLEDQVNSFRDNQIPLQKLQDMLITHNLQEVDHTIERIEQNKKKISRSATKLL